MSWLRGEPLIRTILAGLLLTMNLREGSGERRVSLRVTIRCDGYPIGNIGLDGNRH